MGSGSAAAEPADAPASPVRDQRPAEREIADPVGGVEALSLTRRALGRKSPPKLGLGQDECTVQRVSPACGARLSAALPRKSKAKSIRDRLRIERSGVDPGEEAAPAAASAAGLQPQRLAVGR